MRRIGISVLAVGTALAGLSPAHGYDSEIVHPLINRTVYWEADVAGVLQGRLGIDPTSVYEQTDPTDDTSGDALRLFEHGGAQEDAGVRWLNHFHDPLRTWDHAGTIGMPSSVWAQYDGQDFLNLHTWNRSVRYLRTALAAASAADRNAGVGDLMRALGQQVHLVSDTSVPEHVRNDIHPFHGSSWPWYQDYEVWCQLTLGDLDIPARLDPGDGVFPPHPNNGQGYYRYVGGPPDGIFAQSLVPGLSPVSNLWDSWVPADDGDYNDRLWNPAEWWRVGLAEYTNFNYFSWDTREFWGTPRPYEHPAEASLVARLVRVPPPPGQSGPPDEVVCYAPRSGADPQYDINVWCLAATDLHWQEWAERNPDQQLAATHLDETTHAYYAVNLVPRAVGYGVALVDYFFRGQVEVTAEGDRLTVANQSQGDRRIEGKVTVYADATDGTRTAVEGWTGRPVALEAGASVTLTGPLPPGSVADQYVLVLDGSVESAPGSAVLDAAVTGHVFTWTPPPAYTVCPAGCPFASIQAAIDAASEGDVIVVGPNIYRERINFRGKAVTVRSADGPWNTVIDGEGGGSVVTFRSGEGFGSILQGFTLTNGEAMGGGILCDASPTIVGNVVRGNRGMYGGGVFVGNYRAPLLLNNEIWDNEAEVDGGGLFIGFQSFPTLFNDTIFGNRAGYNGGAYYAYYWSVPVLRNAILWGNQQTQAPWSYAVITYSDVEGGYPGEGNLSPAAPQFRDEAGGDLHLAEGSPCIDRGSASQDPCPSGATLPFPSCVNYIPLPVPTIDLDAYQARLVEFFPTDIDGDPRPQGSGFDIGADERFAAPLL